MTSSVKQSLGSVLLVSVLKIQKQLHSYYSTTLRGMASEHFIGVAGLLTVCKELVWNLLETSIYSNASMPEDF